MEGEEATVVSKGPLEIDDETCLLCAACAVICPTGALHMAGLTLEFEDGLCNNCTLCIPACPTAAITARERHCEDGTTGGSSC